jgi:hypothetical protein
MPGDARTSGRSPTLNALLSDLAGSYAGDESSPAGRVVGSVERLASVVDRGVNAIERVVSALERIASVVEGGARGVEALERSAAALERLAAIIPAEAHGTCRPGVGDPAACRDWARWCRGRVSPLSPRCARGS